MTEAEWLVCADPAPMLEFVQGRTNDRKLRLFAVACCRLVRYAWGDKRIREGFEALEVHADRGGTHAYWVPFSSRVFLAATVAPGPATSALLAAVNAAAQGRTDYGCVRVAEEVADALGDGERRGKMRRGKRRQTRLLRDIVGNPFRPVTFPPSWRTDTALSLAQGVYESRDFSGMPILADALQDAGCDSAEVLDHCRGPGPHVRGCWVIDLVLGKA